MDMGVGQGKAQIVWTRIWAGNYWIGRWTQASPRRAVRVPQAPVFFFGLELGHDDHVRIWFLVL
jgi:hypothetical protein